MTNPFDQLYKTKLQLIAVLAVVGGTALLMLAHWATTAVDAPSWLANLPVAELGSTLFGTGLLAVFFEYVDRKHGDQRADQRVRDAIRHEAPAIRDVVLHSFALDPDTLKDVASNETLDRIATNALGLRLDDPALAHDVYTDVRDQVIRAPERWRDVDISVTLAPWKQGPTTGRGSMFEVTLRCEYRVRPASPTMRFVCVSDLAEYRELLRDPTITAPWYVDQSGGVDAANRETFELLQLTVNGKARRIRRTERPGAQLYAASLSRAATTGGRVTIAYTYRILVQRHGHVLYLDLPRPAKGLHIQLDYAHTAVRRVTTLDFIASSELTRVDHSPSTTSAKTVDVGFDGWVFPRSGVAFVWVLEEELAPGKSSPS